MHHVKQTRWMLTKTTVNMIMIILNVLLGFKGLSNQTRHSKIVQ